jgi:hypothetical protein
VEFPVFVLFNRCQRSQHYQTGRQEQHVGGDFGDPDDDRPPHLSNEAVSRAFNKLAAAVANMGGLEANLAHF